MAYEINPVLRKGEFAVRKRTNEGIFGDGTKRVNQLPVATGITYPTAIEGDTRPYGMLNGKWVAVDFHPNHYYKIRKDGSDIATLKLPALRRKIADGTAQSEYGIGAQLIIPYTDPFTGTEYECPFNFGTFRQFTRPDGTTFNGLGLQAHYLLPTLEVQFDAPESENSDSFRAQGGNNRYLYSAIRQWMNSEGTDWWESQHDDDASPASDANWAVDINGMLSCFPTDFVDAIQPVRTVVKTASLDGGGLDTISDKFFLLSTRETNVTVENSSVGLSDDTEGTYWEYWRQHNELEDYRPIEQAFANGVQYKIENHEEAGRSWLRSARLSSNNMVYVVFASGSVEYSTADTLCRVAPACVLAPLS